MKERNPWFRTLGVVLAGALLPACSGPSATGGGTVKVQIGGEEIATDGFKFPEGSEVVITDGWQIEFSHVLVSVGRVWLAENANIDPFDQSKTGDVVAELEGPWLVDLHQEGSEPGAEGEGTAILIGTFDRQDAKGGAPLQPGEYYAFSFDTVAATAGSELVNLGEDAEVSTLRDEMVARAYTVYYTGKATFKGTGCETSDQSYDFAKIPAEIDFKLGFATPVSHLNCQNQENQGEPIDGENYPRGVILRENEPALAQMTFHLEHPFYSTVTHEPRLYFDQLAARLVGKPQGTVLTMDDVVGVDPSLLTDGEDTALPWRSCDGSTTPSTAERFFDTGTVPINPGASPGDALRDYRDFVHYVQSTQGHMNGGEGICFTQRNYPSPL
jgi:hypothetical protein